MIAVDTNILVYAHRNDSPFHSAAKAFLGHLADGAQRWAIPWPCLHEFFGIVTHPRVFRVPTPADLGIAQVEAWLSSPNLKLLHESSSHWQTLKRLVVQADVYGPRIHDARIAALCIQHGVTAICSADRDFKRFTDLPVRNPLMSD